jgi:type II secretory pathway pseudopilin PulG
MSIINLIVALALMGGLWVAIVKALAASIRRTDRIEAAAARAAEAAARRSPTANRPSPVLPTYTGAPNSRIVDEASAMKDLHA